MSGYKGLNCIISFLRVVLYAFMLSSSCLVVRRWVCGTLMCGFGRLGFKFGTVFRAVRSRLAAVPHSGPSQP